MLGFVLQGYPKTIEQFQYFEETLEITPSHIFMLQSDFNFINERVGNRMIDNHTLIVYLSSEVKDLDEDIKKRLQPVLQESEESLRKRYFFGFEKKGLSYGSLLKLILRRSMRKFFIRLMLISQERILWRVSRLF